MLRAENEGFIKLKVEVDNEEAIDFIEENTLKGRNESTEQVKISHKRQLQTFIRTSNFKRNFTRS